MDYLKYLFLSLLLIATFNSDAEDQQRGWNQKGSNWKERENGRRNDYRETWDHKKGLNWKDKESPEKEEDDDQPEQWNYQKGMSLEEQEKQEAIKKGYQEEKTRYETRSEEYRNRAREQYQQRARQEQSNSDDGQGDRLRNLMKSKMKNSRDHYQRKR
jgi:hypothetical protein